MDIIFEKDKNNIIIPVFKNKLNEANFELFIAQIKNSKTDEFITSLFNLIKNAQETTQILLDIKYIFKTKGLIEVLIEKYVHENQDHLKLKEFFIYISNNFQIGKDIYDSIYREIGKLFLTEISFSNFQKTKNKFHSEKQIFEKCVDLLIIFYKKNIIENEFFHDNFFYLYDNEIKVSLNNETCIKIK